MIATVQRSPVVMDRRNERYQMFLLQTSLFQKASPTSIADLVNQLEVRSRPRGQMIFTEGEAANRFCILVSGRVRLVRFGDNGRELSLSHLKPGDFFGAESLAAEATYTASAVAFGDVAVLMIPRELLVD